MQQIALMNDEERFGQVADERLDDIVAENAERNTDLQMPAADGERDDAVAELDAVRRLLVHEFSERSTQVPR